MINAVLIGIGLAGYTFNTIAIVAQWNNSRRVHALLAAVYSLILLIKTVVYFILILEGTNLSVLPALVAVSSLLFLIVAIIPKRAIWIGKR